jgi:hypothetical protein
MGRGKSQRSLELIDACIEILRAIWPATVRAVCYQLFNRRLIESMAKVETNRVGQQLTDARGRGWIPHFWIVDETREAECLPSWASPAAYVERPAFESVLTHLPDPLRPPIHVAYLTGWRLHPNCSPASGATSTSSTGGSASTPARRRTARAGCSR